ncbi:MAG: Gfo/Idh/MocA family oxidoreductase [Acidobacteriota bacterium]|nr:MAG: Gfo/Idh/MocA family oxidoreductase [Acidobacteriota bacterium]
MKHVGILGGGNISETHLKAALEIEDVEVVAVCGQNHEKTAKLAEMAGARAYTDLEAFLSHKPMDLVAIGSPSGVHTTQGIAAARRGLHVLVEKPIDISTYLADQLIDECASAGVKLGVFFQDRVADDLKQLKMQVDSGKLGRLLLVTAHVKWYRPAEYYGDSKWRGTWAFDGGGAVINQAIHTLDLLLWLCGPVRRVVALTKTQLHKIETEDTAVAILEFENGALGTFEAATSAYPGFPRKVVLSGSRGSATVEHDRIASLDFVGVEKASGQELARDRNASESSAVVSNVSGHRRLLEDFIAAIDEDRKPLCDGSEGRRSIALVEAIYRSAREGGPVNLR